MKMTPLQSGTAACLLDAMVNKEIARAMNCSVRVVERRVARLIVKFKARNKIDLALILQEVTFKDKFPDAFHDHDEALRVNPVDAAKVRSIVSGVKSKLTRAA